MNAKLGLPFALSKVFTSRQLGSKRKVTPLASGTCRGLWVVRACSSPCLCFPQHWDFCPDHSRAPGPQGQGVRPLTCIEASRQPAKRRGLSLEGALRGLKRKKKNSKSKTPGKAGPKVRGNLPEMHARVGFPPQPIKSSEDLPTPSLSQCLCLSFPTNGCLSQCCQLNAVPRPSRGHSPWAGRAGPPVFPSLGNLATAG